MSNTAVAVNPGVTYVVATDGTETLVVAEPLVGAALGEGWEVVETYAGTDMERWEYDASLRPRRVPAPTEPAPHFVVLADYVTTEDGSGLVHQSPAFGEEDMAVCRGYGLPVVNPVLPDGHFEDDVPAGRRAVLQARRRRPGPRPRGARADVPPRRLRALLPALLALPHRAACTTRCRPGTSGPPSARTPCSARTRRTNWHPETIKWGRYGDWLNNNIDWALSRRRYWGTPLPIWRCEEGHQTCVGSLAELTELTGTDQSDLDPHRPFVDDGRLRLPGRRLRR